MIEVACIADEAFLRHTGAMLHSALRSSPSSRFSVRVLHATPIAQSERARLHSVVEGLGSTLRFEYIADASCFPDGYFPRAVWLRILLPELMPDTARVLYLDSDLIVTDDLAPLWRTDLGDHLLGAVTNPFYPFMPDHPRLRLGIENPRDYFNSGVLLMDLERMRAEKTAEKLRQFALTHRNCDYPDQDALNDVCRGRWQHLHPRWNVQSTLYELAARHLPLPAADVAEALHQPAVIHFIGPFKPWHYLCRHPRQALYFEHARATPWGEPALQGRSARNALLRQLPLKWIDRWFRIERRLARIGQRLRRRADSALA
ncbi:MAG: glycosyltransferase family 8 protein [Sinimarinibacterium sp.]|jgi:lipopolysaccharide biosynthesis glycosyltransferase